MGGHSNQKLHVGVFQVKINQMSSTQCGTDSKWGKKRTELRDPNLLLVEKKKYWCIPDCDSTKGSKIMLIFVDKSQRQSIIIIPQSNQKSEQLRETLEILKLCHSRYNPVFLIFSWHGSWFSRCKKIKADSLSMYSQLEPDEQL